MQARVIKIVCAVIFLAIGTMAFTSSTTSQNTYATFPTDQKEDVMSLPAYLASADGLEMNPCSMENTAFQHEEILTYKIYYNWNFIWIPAGEVMFKVTDEGDQYHLSAKGKTYSSYEWFFKVRDNYDTYIDKETLLPTVGIRDVHEGNYTLYDKVTFDQDRQKTISVRGSHKDKTILREFDVDACMHDVLSIVYYTRNINFDYMDKGDKFPIQIFMDKQSWPLRVKYKGKREQTKVKGSGSYKTIKFSPEVISGEVFEEDTEMNIWATDDQNKIPVLIESPVSVGSVKVVLDGYANLRYPMTAKID
ncbi:MAG: DUF3108 domain-containing protein [Saprospiraceae bacterium]